MAVFVLPDLGEGLTEATVLRWLVAVGDAVVLNQPLVEVETAKAAVEVPSPFAGVVAELHCAEGVEARVGEPLVTVTLEAEAKAGAQSGAGARTPVLVGYGPRSATASRRARKHVPSVSRTAPAAPAPLPAAAPDRAPLVAPSAAPVAAPAAPAARRPEAPRPLAKPLVRKLARERGVDLAAVTPTGPYGTVSREDVERAAVAPAGRMGDAGARPGTPGGRLDPPEATGATGDVVPVIGVHRSMAQAMVRSAAVPTATLFLTVDVTASTRLAERLRLELDGTRVTPLLLTARALLLALRRHPEANASWVEDGPMVRRHPRVHLGIAAATPRGLLVPNIKDAGPMPLAQLARALDDLVAAARDGRTRPADLASGTATITNIGSFGIDSGTPVLNPGEAVILALGAVRPTPWVVDGAIVVRDVCQLALSFDHRVLDGAQAAGLLADVGRVLRDPDVVHAWGDAGCDGRL